MSPEAEAAGDAKALADNAAGKGVPHEKVVAWLKTWSTPQEAPPPRRMVRIILFDDAVYIARIKYRRQQRCAISVHRKWRE